MRMFHAFICDTRAASAVEVALTMPFFLIFVAVILETATFFFANAAVEQAMFNYSRLLPTMARTARTATIQEAMDKELRNFVGPYLIKSFKFEIGPATGVTDFNKVLTANKVTEFTKDKSKPIYFRVVATRRTFTRKSLSYVWNAISPSKDTGLFTPIDVLIVIPFPDESK